MWLLCKVLQVSWLWLAESDCARRNPTTVFVARSCLFVCLLVGCLTSQLQASVSQGRICEDNFTYCHTEIQVADPTFYLTQSQYTDTGPTSPNADPITPGAWQGSHWSANVLSHWYDSTPKKSRRKRDSNPGPPALEADALELGERGGRAPRNPMTVFVARRSSDVS